MKTGQEVETLTACNRKHVRFSSVMYGCNLLSKQRNQSEQRWSAGFYSQSVPLVYSLLNSFGKYGTLVNASFRAADEIAS